MHITRFQVGPREDRGAEATLACSGVVVDHNTSSLNTSTKPEKVSVNAELMKVRDC